MLFYSPLIIMVAIWSYLIDIVSPKTKIDQICTFLALEAILDKFVGNDKINFILIGGERVDKFGLG